jgi:transcriptional regulator with XRE-family HTH domain
MTLGERIKYQRNKNGFTQEKVAELVGISRQAVTKWESGQSIPSMENLMALTKIFEISLSELTNGVNDSIPIENTFEMAVRKKAGTVKLISAVILAIIGVIIIVIISNMNSIEISRLANVGLQSAHLVRLGVQMAGGVFTLIAIALFISYIKECKNQ